VWDVASLPPASADDAAPAEAQRPEDRAAAEWVLKKGGIVQVRVEGAYLDVNNLELLPEEPFRLTRIDTIGKPITDDAALENFKGLTELKALILYDSKVTGAGLAHLKDSMKLEEVNLDRAPFTDAGLELLAGFPNLSSIALRGTKISDAGVAHLAGLTKVRNLALSGTGISDAGLEQLKGWTRLDALWLEGTKINGTGLGHLQGSKGVRVLYLQGCPITDEGLAKAAGWPRLAELYLDGKDVAVTDAGLAVLSRLKNLRQLRLAGKVSDGGLAHLKGLPRLHNLWLDNLPITDAGLEHLKGLRLDTLGVANTKVTPAAVEKLRKEMPKGNPPPGDFK
jgi:hypothetical protein